MYTKLCPDCHKELSYKWPCALKRSIELNSTCKSCRTRKANLSIRRYNKGPDNPFWKGYESIPQSWFSKYFQRANRKRTGSITIEDVWRLYIKQDKKCALTGLPLSFTKTSLGISASIDRIDSSKEYILENIQLVHKDINLMKNHFKEEYFIEMCSLVHITRSTI